MDRGAWWAVIPGVVESRMWLKWLSMHTLSFVRNCWTVFQSDCAVLYFTSSGRVPVVPHPHHHLMFPGFWIWAYSFNRCVAMTHCCSVYFPGNMWCRPPFHMLIPLCVFLVKCLLRFLAHCLTGLFVPLFFTFKSSCTFWITVLYQTCLLTCWFKLTDLVLLYFFD